MNKRFTLALCLGAICSLAANDVQAQCGLGYGGYGVYDVGRLYRVLAQNVPYYAAFPPVYYSAPVPRTYGHSPFAYPPGTKTPEIVKAAPLEVLNPHVQASSIEPAENSDKTTQLDTRPQPLAIVNPYATSQISLFSLSPAPLGR